jgi:aminoglycoside 3-N-acetyltransferase
MLAGQREWVRIRDIALDWSDFERIGEDFERKTGEVRRGEVGDAAAQLMPQRDLVDFAVAWMEEHREE